MEHISENRIGVNLRNIDHKPDEKGLTSNNRIKQLGPVSSGSQTRENLEGWGMA